MKYAVLFLWLISLPTVLAQQPKTKSSSSTTPKKTTAAATKAAKPKPKSTAAAKTAKSKPKTTVAGKTTKTKTSTAPAKKVVAAATPKPTPTPTPTPLTEKEQFVKASGYELAADRVPALEKFIAEFPESSDRPAAAELLASSRILIAEEKILSGESADAVAIFRQVVEQMPQPVPNELFNESIAKIPSTLFFRGQRAAALELAALIESKVENNAAQLVEVANFHLSTENGSDAMRVAAKALARDPASPAVHRMIALAHRINFDLDLAADSYARSLELDPDSVASKRGLAEMKRALGKSDEAATLYRELVAKDEKDLQSRTGLILALFDAGKRAEAETELAKSLEATPGNVILLAGAAYWYASKGIGDKAVELAEKAIGKEPRYIWSHIALARGLMSQKKPVEAEQVLIKARAFGNFPTLEYELASARMAAGFFREAVEDLQKQFSVTPDGTIKTNLGARVPREEKTLADLVAFERKASIFAPVAADSRESAEALRALLIFDQKLRAAEPDENEIAAAADAFTSGSDKMKLHRQIYAASALLQKRVALNKVLELTKAATGNTDAGLDVANPRAAVMASELYEARVAAFRSNDFLIVPDVPRPTLSAILRGQIEEIAGWALYQQNNFPDAVIRLRRAISVMPDKSAWWRSSMWRLGAALAADGKDAEALNSYIESYKTDKPDFAKYAVVETLYRKVNGNIDGLEEKIGKDRVAAAPAVQIVEPVATPSPTPADTAVSTPTGEAPSISATPSPAVTEPASDPPKTEPAAMEPSKAADPNTATSSESTTTAGDQKISESEKTVPAADKNSVEPDKTVPARDPKASEPEKAAPINDQKQTDADTTLPAGDPKPTEPDPSTEKPTAIDQEVKPPPSEPPKETTTDNPKPNTGTTPIEVKSEPLAKLEPQPATIQTESKSSEKTPSRPSADKPLFEPIIITIPNNRIAKPTADAATKNGKGETSKADSQKKTGESTSGDARPRVIDGQEVKVDESLAPCAVSASQENISLINNGGTVGLLVHVEAPGDVKALIATSSSPKDIELTLEPEIGGLADKRFFVIKSVSTKLGVYQVAFVTPCGKKEILVTVR